VEEDEEVAVKDYSAVWWGEGAEIGWEEHGGCQAVNLVHRRLLACNEDG